MWQNGTDTVQPIDTSVITIDVDSPVKTITVQTDDVTKVGVFTIMYEVSLEDYPGVTPQTQSNVYVLTILDRCSFAQGLRVNAPVFSHPDKYYYDGYPLVIKADGVFTTNDANCYIESHGCLTLAWNAEKTVSVAHRDTCTL